MLRKLNLKAGIDREGTGYSAEGGWYNCDKVRFRKGRAEKIGGWIERSASTVFGVCRSLHNWSSLLKNNYLGICTNSRIYVELGGDIYDITPSYEYGLSYLTTGITTSGVTVSITNGDVVAKGWIIGDVGRISSPVVSNADGGVSGADDVGGPFEYVYVSGTNAGADPDTLTVTRGYLDSTEQKHSYNSTTAKGPTIERIPKAEVRSAPTTASLGGPIGLVNGSATVLIRQEDHGCISGDYVTFLQLGAAVSDGTVDDDDFLTTDGFRVGRSLDDDNYEIEIGDSGASTITSNLSTSITVSTSPIVVTSSVFSGTNFYVKIEDEYIKIASVSGASLTVSARGEFGSVAAPHTVVPGATISVDKVDFVAAGLTYILHDINSGIVSYLGASGWGAGGWGADGWGDTATTTDAIRIWSIDNYGEDLVLCPRDGTPYYWDISQKITEGIPNRSPSTAGAQINLNVAFAQAMPLNTIGSHFDPDYSITDSTDAVSAAPTKVRQIMVYPNSRQVVAFGCSDYGGIFNPMMVRWSSDLYPGSWDHLDTHRPGISGYQILSTGSEIIGACRSKMEVLIWTDAAIYKMDWLGPESEYGVFRFSELASNISIMGPLAYVASADSIYWMGDRNFYVYNGTISAIPCSVLNYVFGDLNYSQREVIFSASNNEFNEITFFYPSGESLEPDRYVTYNYSEDLWTIGTMERTAWSDSGLREKPQAAAIYSSDDNTSKIYEQETGWEEVDTAMTSFIESGYFDLDDGDHFSFISRIIPDVLFLDGNDLTIQIKKKDFPNDAEDSSPSSSAITDTTTQDYVRVRGRQIAVRFESTGTNVGWRLGDTRLDIRPDGRR